MPEKWCKMHFADETEKTVFTDIGTYSPAFAQFLYERLESARAGEAAILEERGWLLEMLKDVPWAIRQGICGPDKYTGQGERALEIAKAVEKLLEEVRDGLA